MKVIKKIPIIYYHSIGPIHKNWNRNFLTLEPDKFEKQIRAFKKRFKIIDLQEYWEIRNYLKLAPKNPLVINIDDGFLDNWIWAFPILKKYEVKATIFVSPELVDNRDIIRPNMYNYRKTKFSNNETLNYGYLSWPEIREMLSSGLVDIQSHTMSHTKYFISDKITSFHHPNGDCLYPIGNIDNSLKPYHIGNKSFEKRLPYGTPFFEEKSSVIARKVEINPEFTNECIAFLDKYDFNNYSFNEVFEIVRPLYESYQKNNKVILGTESEKAFGKRLSFEIEESKRIIESETNNKIEFLCWPHGDNNEEAHNIAISAGYKATTIGKADVVDSGDRIALRIGVAPYKGSTVLGIRKALSKIYDYQGNKTAVLLKKMYKLTKKN